MTLRIRFPQGKLVRRERPQHRDLLLAATSLLTPMCVMAYVLAVWRLASDIGVTEEPGARGLFSHWQVWIVLALALQFTGRFFARRMSAEGGPQSFNQDGLNPDGLDPATGLDQATR